jgi:hypothetical protein
MVPRMSHANGVPWLIWFGTHSWECRRCKAKGSQPRFDDVSSFARWAGDLKREHAPCGDAIVLRPGEVGHPLNPDRAER